MIKLDWNFEYDSKEKRPKYRYLRHLCGVKLIREVNSILAKQFAESKEVNK